MKLRNKILDISNHTTQGHEKVFTWLAKKSKTSLWFTFLLMFMALLIWWGLQ